MLEKLRTKEGLEAKWKHIFVLALLVVINLGLIIFVKPSFESISLKWESQRIVNIGRPITVSASRAHAIQTTLGVRYTPW